MMELREKIFDSQYFNKRIASLSNYVIEDEIEIRMNLSEYTKPQLLFYALFKKYYQLVILEYSRGEDIDKMQKKFIQVIDAYEKNNMCPNHVETIFEEDIDDYVISLWLFSLSILLKQDIDITGRLVNCIGNNGKDILFEGLLSKAYLGNNMLNAKKIIYPKVYQNLYEITLSPKEFQPIIMIKFLENWYESMNKCYWHNSHKGKDGGGFFGYWCWEAAAVTVIYGIDDSLYKNMPYYPKDIVDFYRTTI